MAGDNETGETIISGMGELHLEIIVDRMKREFNVDANVGRPQVAYKETIIGEADGEGKYIKQSGGRGQYGHVKLRVKPLERGGRVCVPGRDQGRFHPEGVHQPDRERRQRSGR